jgi:hypothetical protein
VGCLSAAQVLGTVDGDLLDDIHMLTAAVVAPAQVPSAYSLVSTDPCASITARGAKFSERSSRGCSPDGGPPQRWR